MLLRPLGMRRSLSVAAGPEVVWFTGYLASSLTLSPGFLSPFAEGRLDGEPTGFLTGDDPDDTFYFLSVVFIGEDLASNGGGLPLLLLSLLDIRK